MVLIFFTRDSETTHRVYIGVKSDKKMYRIGYKTYPYKNTIKLSRHFYEINEKINIIKNPDFSLISKNDLEFYYSFFKL